MSNLKVVDFNDDRREVILRALAEIVKMVKEGDAQGIFGVLYTRDGYVRFGTVSDPHKEAGILLEAAMTRLSDEDE